MPQLFSRMDDANWLTPAIAEILEQGAAPPSNAGSIREQTVILDKELSDLGTPVRMGTPRLTPSHTLFEAQPTSGGLGRKAITPMDIRRSMARIAEQHKDWTLGFLSEVRDAGREGSVGILLRNDQHQPISLRRMLVRNTFRDYPSAMTLAMGLTLDDQMIIRDLANIGHLVVVGSDNPKRHFIRSLLLTLVLFNTPAEMRLAMVGAGCQAYSALSALPHMLGRLLTSPDDGQRLLDGLTKEAQRRQQYIQDNNLASFDAYNARLREQGTTPLPRIVVLIDSISDESWKSNPERWLPTLQNLLANGREVGIHILLVSETTTLPEGIDIPTQILMRSLANEVIEKLKDFPKPNLRFVDAFVVEPDQINPVELCLVTEGDITRTVDYWKEAGLKRKQESPAAAPAPDVSARTGVTGVFRGDSEAARYLASRENQTTAQAVNPNSLMQRASALAAYLGWIGSGALRDVLGVSELEAQTLISALQAAGVIEQGDSAVLRFIRLSDNPLNK
jgi:hypothetical protein